MDSFENSDFNLSIHAPLNATLVSGSLRKQDIIPACLRAINSTPEYVAICMNSSLRVPSFAMEDDSSCWWDGDDAQFLLDELFDILNGYAPEGFIFGAHMGNGSDFGYWICEEVLEDREALEKLAERTVSSGNAWGLIPTIADCDEEDLIAIIACNGDESVENKLLQSYENA